jgi:dihydrofolate reductase
MGKVLFNASVSLDGFVAGPHGEVDRLFRWYSSGDVEVPFQGTDMVFRLSRASAARLQHFSDTIGAIITGRDNFDVAGAWNGKPPLGVHHFVMTHRSPQEWVKQGSPFTFVAGGVENAVAQAKAHAGDKDVAVSTASVMQQCLRAGLLDEIHLDLVPVLLGEGIRLFDHLGDLPLDLEVLDVVEGNGVTHLAYRVVK